MIEDICRYCDGKAVHVGITKCGGCGGKFIPELEKARAEIDRLKDIFDNLQVQAIAGYGDFTLIPTVEWDDNMKLLKGDE